MALALSSSARRSGPVELQLQLTNISPLQLHKIMNLLQLLIFADAEKEIIYIYIIYTAPTITASLLSSRSRYRHRVLILASSHPRILVLASSRPRILASPRPHVLAASRPHVLTALHPRVVASSHRRVVASSHRRVVASSHRHVVASSRRRLAELVWPLATLCKVRTLANVLLGAVDAGLTVAEHSKVTAHALTWPYAHVRI